MKSFARNLFRGFGKRHIRLKQCHQQRDVTKTNHVRVCVHFRSAVFKQAADILKSGAGSLRIVRRNGTRSGKKTFADSIRIGMKNKCSENIAQNHSTEN